MKIASKEIADRVRTQILQMGDRRAAELLAMSRNTAVRVAARLPVQPSILLAAEHLLPQLESAPNK